MRATRSPIITALLAAVGAAFAVSALIGAPTAVAQPTNPTCEPGQVLIDGKCTVPQTHATNVPAPPPGNPGMGGHYGY
jgi:hypothetical protein